MGTLRLGILQPAAANNAGAAEHVPALPAIHHVTNHGDEPNASRQYDAKAAFGGLWSTARYVPTRQL